ncbi:MAG: hypothetical protein R2709_04895 [Marmoricola sp.]
MARADPRSTKRLLATVFLMPWFTIMAGWLLLTLRDRYQAPGSTSWERVQDGAGLDPGSMVHLSSSAKGQDLRHWACSCSGLG